jgi:hypothetical protein
MMAALSSSTALAPPSSPAENSPADCRSGESPTKSRSPGRSQPSRSDASAFVKREVSSRPDRTLACRAKHAPALPARGASLRGKALVRQLATRPLLPRGSESEPPRPLGQKAQGGTCFWRTCGTGRADASCRDRIRRRCGRDARRCGRGSADERERRAYPGDQRSGRAIRDPAARRNIAMSTGITRSSCGGDAGLISMTKTQTSTT